MTDIAQEPGDGALTPPASAGSVSASRAALIGLRQPIVVVLLLIALFTTISGIPLAGLLMLTVAMLLTLEAAKSYRRPAGREGSDGAGVGLARPVSPILGSPAAGLAECPGARRRALTAGRGAALAAVGTLYAGIVGSLSRYSRPATLAVASLGCVLIGALTDPLLASHPGRSVALGGWLVIGWYLADR